VPGDAGRRRAGVTGAAHRAPRRERNLLAAADLVLRCALFRDMDLCLGAMAARAADAALAHTERSLASG
jgi:hypothetical protein